MEERDGLLTATENRYAGYMVYDDAGKKIGKVEDFFVDEDDRTQYIGVRVASLGPDPALIPMDIARVNEQLRLVEISASKERVKDALTLDDGDETTLAFEQQVECLFGVVNDGVLEVPPVDWMAPFLLICLQERDRHSHELARKMIDSGFEATHPEEMNRTLQQMENEGVLVSEDDGFDRELSRRRYSITESGDAYLEYLADALMQYGEKIDLFFRLYNKPLIREPRLKHDGL
ncbi:MAG: PRC-barrel domain-containing protein [Rubrobacter sp.]|nr:PRC-barrel domain-containing protein [Rubrobacter sp.]